MSRQGRWEGTMVDDDNDIIVPGGPFSRGVLYSLLLELPPHLGISAGTDTELINTSHHYNNANLNT